MRFSEQGDHCLKMLRLAGPLTTGQLAWAKAYLVESLDLVAQGRSLPRVKSRGDHESAYSSISRTLAGYVCSGLVVERGRHPKWNDILYALPPVEHETKLVVLDFLAVQTLKHEEYDRLVRNGASVGEVLNAMSAVKGIPTRELLVRLKAVVEMVEMFEGNGHE